MIHHTVAKIFVSTKLRDLGPKSSATRMFWRMVATCIRYQPHTEHLLWDLTTFSLASVKTPWVGTGFLGLTYSFHHPSNSLDDTPEFPQILPICPGDHITAIGGKDVLRLAMATPLPPVGLLEKVLLSLKEGESLSESTLRRLRRKEAEMRAAAAEGTPLREYRKRKQKKIATRTCTPQASYISNLCRVSGIILDQAMYGLSSEKETSTCQEPNPASVTEAHTPPKAPHQRPTTQFMRTVNLLDSERRKVSVEEVERLAASASARHPDSQGIQAS